MKANQRPDAMENLLLARTVKKYKTVAERKKGFAVVYTRVSSQEQAEMVFTC